MQQKFIVTQDEQTAKMLLASGFKLVSSIGITYTFLNDACKSLNFEKSKVVYTNVLNV